MKDVFMGTLNVMLYLLIPAIFGGIGAGVFFGLIKPQMDAGKILKTGIETTATVIGIDSGGTASSSSGNTTKTVQYHYLTLSFINSEGNEIEYKTRSIYPEIFINKNNVEKGGTVQIMYAGDKAVVKGFIPGHETWLWIFPVVFGGIAAGFLILLLAGIMRNTSIKQYGTDGTGVYLEHSKSAIVGGKPYYVIRFSFKNDNGIEVEAQTDPNYLDFEAEALAEMKTFPIKYKGDKAIIMIDKKSIEK